MPEKKCPQCNSSDIIPIVYGMPSPGFVEQSFKEEVKLGGCCIPHNPPNKHCTECEFEWH